MISRTPVKKAAMITGVLFVLAVLFIVVPDRHRGDAPQGDTFTPAAQAAHTIRVYEMTNNRGNVSTGKTFLDNPTDTFIVSMRCREGNGTIKVSIGFPKNQDTTQDDNPAAPAPEEADDNNFFGTEIDCTKTNRRGGVVHLGDEANKYSVVNILVEAPENLRWAVTVDAATPGFKTNR